MGKTWDLFNLWQNVHSFVMFPLFYFIYLFIFSSAIVENMAEFRPGLCSEAAQQGLMQWLLKRIKVKMATVKQEEFKSKHNEVCCHSTSFCSKAGLFRDCAEEGHFLMHAAASHQQMKWQHQPWTFNLIIFLFFSPPFLNFFTFLGETFNNPSPLRAGSEKIISKGLKTRAPFGEHLLIF